MDKTLSINTNEAFDDLAKDISEGFKSRSELFASIVSVLGDSYFPNLPLEQLKQKFPNEDLLFLRIWYDGLYTPQKPSVRTWGRDVKYDYMMMSFGNNKTEDFITVYFRIVNPTELIISNSSYERIPSLKDRSKEEIFAEIGLGVNWIIIPESFFDECNKILNQFREDEKKKKGIVKTVTAKTIKAREDVKELLKTTLQRDPTPLPPKKPPLSDEQKEKLVLIFKDLIELVER
jgi:hypothetical protein